MNPVFPFRFLFLCTLPALVLTGCCYINDVSAFTDPDFPSPRYDRVVIHAPLANFEWRQTLEESIVNELLSTGITAYKGAAVLPPTRDWTLDAEEDALKKSGAQAVLQITITGVSVHEQYVPPRTETKVENERKETRRGETRTYDTSTVVTTSTSGGFVQKSESTHLRIVLTDLSTGRVAWIATTQLPDIFPRCADSFAAKLAERLAADGAIRQP